MNWMFGIPSSAIWRTIRNQPSRRTDPVVPCGPELL